ncbi:MAG: glycosyltransferase [Sedimentitalea sp.]
MSSRSLRLLEPRTTTSVVPPRLPLGRYLVARGTITSQQLVLALQLQLSLGASLGEILVAEGWASSQDIYAALAEQHGLRHVDPALQPPDARLCMAKPCAFWLKHRVLPWNRINGRVQVATSHPDQFEALRPKLGAAFAESDPVIATPAQIEQAIARQFTQQLAETASTRVASRYSCRGWKTGNRLILPACLALIIGLGALAPVTGFAILAALAVLTLILFTGLRLAGAVAHVTAHKQTAPVTEPPKPVGRLPKVSVLVPLYREKEIAGALIKRLNRLSYPKALLDVILVLEAGDTLTRKTVADTDLPSWMRVIEVPPHGSLTTKPRAMNYALDFCHGDIIGIWDAEDAPAPEQIEHVVARFQTARSDVACLQGVLDYYNPRTNWLARCFTIEYSSWFRVVLPGIARLGLVVPLGGTTLFFKRNILEKLGGWDAHNVTEDADLGVRLCRAGYRTELLETATFEEANCRPWPWVKQRSRWLKGFMVTYLVHMRHPRRLLSDLGPRRFLGVQAFFLGTLGQFLLAPVLWSFWLMFLGLGHPLQSVMPTALGYALMGLFLGAEVLAITVGMIAVARPDRRDLMKWVPTLIFYFPLGALAAYKALYELIFAPYYWDKTQHGIVSAEP